MSSNAAKDDNRLGCLPFVIGGLSFVPLFGVLFGLVAIVWGLVARKRGGGKLALIGAAGIAFSVLLYGGLFYFGFVQRGGLYDDLRAKMAQSNLNALVTSIEFYKLGHGEYPDTLDTLKASLKKDSIEAIYVFDPRVSALGQAGQFFYYKRVDAEHYYLRGVVAEGKPVSPGALVPEVTVTSGKIGLLTDSPPNPP
jgi:hypothetical protein